MTVGAVWVVALSGRAVNSGLSRNDGWGTGRGFPMGSGFRRNEGRVGVVVLEVLSSHESKQQPQEDHDRPYHEEDIRRRNDATP